MSKETRKWLSENTLIGFTEKRGTAWHYREGDQNHYPGAIPVDDVHRRLFNWTAEEVPEEWTHNGVRHVSDTDKVVVRSDSGAKLGTFKSGYQPHQYGEWLVSNISTLLHGELGIASAGLLKGGRQAWVQVEMPEVLSTPEGIQIRPFLYGATSFDGSLATQYGRAVTAIVCDNTMHAAIGEAAAQRIKFRHSRKSLDNIGSVRDALGVILEQKDVFSELTAVLTNIPVTDSEFFAFVDAQFGNHDDEPSKRAATLAQAKVDAIGDLWQSDPRVTNWRGTAFGAWQALNTYQQHERTVRGATRPERNMSNLIMGTGLKEDAESLDLIFDQFAPPALLAVS